MKLLILFGYLFCGITFAQKKKEEETPLDPIEQKKQASFALGYQQGIRATRKEIHRDDLNATEFLKGYLEALEGAKKPLSPKEIRESLKHFQKEAANRKARIARDNLNFQNEFLARNQNAPGIYQTASGLQYKKMANGEGEPVGAKKLNLATFKANFRCTLPDGKVVDSSDPDKPANFFKDNVVEGVAEALSMMPKGAKWQIFVPSKLAYGKAHRGDLIGPNQLLIFELEMVKFHLPPPAVEAQTSEKKKKKGKKNGKR